MKKLKKTLIFALSTMLFVCIALFAAACDETPADNNEPAEKTEYTVSLNYDAQKGSAALEPAAEDGKYVSGSSVSVTVTPNADFEVASVTANDTALTLSEGKYTFTVEADTTVTVLFKDKELSVTAVYDEAQGSVTFDSVNEDGKVKKGTAVTATIEPAYGYELVSVTLNGEDVTDELKELPLIPERPELNQYDHSPKRTLSLGEVTEDAAVAVTFQAAKHSVTLTVNGPGTCELFNSTAETESKVTSLTSVSASTKLHAKLSCVSTNYISVEVKVSDGERELKMSVVSGNTYFWVVDKDLTVTVTFTLDREKAPQHQISVTGGENGSYTLTPKGGLPLEDNVFYGNGEATIHLTPNVPADETTTDTYIIDYLKIKSLETDSEEVDVTADLEDGSYTFPVTGDVELSVGFKKFESVKLASPYTGTWTCTIKGESATTSLSVTLSSSTITVKENGVTTATGTPYTATLGYTLYAENIEDSYVVYILPGLNNRVLALTLNGDSTTYYVKNTVSDTSSTIDEQHSIYDSTWYGGAASMPIKFEFGEVYIDGNKGTRLAKKETEEGLSYTVYANGGLYDLIWTEEDDSLVLHPYGKNTADDVSYERETPPTPVLVPQYAGTYSNNEHTVVISETGEFSFDGTVYNFYYEAQTKDYYFKTAKLEYTVIFRITGTLSVFNAGANVEWNLSKIEAGTPQYTLTVNCDNGTVAYSPKNTENKYYAGSTVTLTITPNKHFEVATITVNNEDKKFSSDSGVAKINVTVNAETTVVVTFNELKEENLLSDLYIGTYKGNSITVTITATDVTVEWGSGYGKFTDAQITLTGTKQFTLENTSSRRKFTIKINDDGSITLGDSNYAIGGGSYKLTKQSS